MALADLSCVAFVEKLASRAPVPGGGGACALAGAVGTALGSMVGNLTAGKAKYAHLQTDIEMLLASAADLQRELLELVDRDAAAFEPLSRAYGLPGDTEAQRQAKAEVMEGALAEAARVPVQIMECLCEAVELHRGFAQKGAAIAISDVGVGVALCKAALQGAALNVYINTKAMADRAAARALEERVETLLDTYVPLADEVYRAVLGRLR